MRPNLAIVGALVVCLLPAAGAADTLVAQWDPNPPWEAITEYEVCFGTASLACDVAQLMLSSGETTYGFSASRGVLYFVAVRAISGQGASNYSEVAISIPDFAQPSDQFNGLFSSIGRVDLLVNDPDGGTLHFSQSGLPPGLSINSATGAITGTPTVAGTYTVTISVDDGIITTSQSFQWTIGGSSSGGSGGGGSGSGGALSQVALTSSLPSPQNPGTPITLRAVPTGGSSQNQFQFWVFDPSGGWSIVRDWSTSAQHVWTPTVAGDYYLWVSARTPGSAEVAFQTAFSVISGGSSTPPPSGDSDDSGGPVSSVTLGTDPPNAQVVGVPVTMTAFASGGSSQNEFQFWILDPGGNWDLVQDWSSSATYQWVPSAGGEYVLWVSARSSSSVPDAEAAFETNFSVFGGSDR